jgi:hypothetical protein
VDRGILKLTKTTSYRNIPLLETGEPGYAKQEWRATMLECVDILENAGASS